MSQLTQAQINSVVVLIVDEYGPRLTESEVFEITGLILENISGLETVGLDALAHEIKLIGRQYNESVSKSRGQSEA